MSDGTPQRSIHIADPAHPVVVPCLISCYPSAVAVKEEFTPARYGKSFSLFNSAVGFGSLGLNAMATYIYHHSGTQLANGSWVCYGQQCFENTWIVAGSLVAGFGVVLSLVLLTLVYTKG